MPSKESDKLCVAALRRGRQIAELSVGPISGLFALATAEHDKIMNLYHAKDWRSPTEEEWTALVAICAIYTLHPGGQRIGDRVLHLSSRFTEPKRSLKLRKKKKENRVRLRLKRS